MRFNLQFLFCLVALVACMVIAAPVPEGTVSVEAPVAVEATESSESDLERRGYSGSTFFPCHRRYLRVLH